MADWFGIAKSIAAQEGHPWPDLFARQMQLESGFDESVIYCQRSSSAGAQGIAQFMPGTAGGLGIDPCEPYGALRAAARLMAHYFAQYGDWAKALAAYNAGPGAVQEYGGVPPYEETQRYIVALLGSTIADFDSPGGPRYGGLLVFAVFAIAALWFVEL